MGKNYPQPLENPHMHKSSEGFFNPSRPQIFIDRLPCARHLSRNWWVQQGTKMTCEQNPNETRQAETIWRNGIPGREDSRFKGPAVTGGRLSHKSEGQRVTWEGQLRILQTLVRT